MKQKRHLPGELKFNHGQGALLCPRCRVIVAWGWEHAGKAYDCTNCEDVVVTPPDSAYLD
jgi:hypothetical protein